jgi:hypothetical protein
LSELGNPERFDSLEVGDCKNRLVRLSIENLSEICCSWEGFLGFDSYWKLKLLVRCGIEEGF